jgi:hypothetical protein
MFEQEQIPSFHFPRSPSSQSRESRFFSRMGNFGVGQRHGSALHVVLCFDFKLVRHASTPHRFADLVRCCVHLRRHRPGKCAPLLLVLLSS